MGNREYGGIIRGMLTENDLRTALAEQDEVIVWLVEQNKKLTEENEQLCEIIKSK